MIYSPKLGGCRGANVECWTRLLAFCGAGLGLRVGLHPQLSRTQPAIFHAVSDGPLGSVGPLGSQSSRGHTSKAFQRPRVRWERTPGRGSLYSWCRQAWPFGEWPLS